MYQVFFHRLNLVPLSGFDLFQLNHLNLEVFAFVLQIFNGFFHLRSDAFNVKF
jgi:hypothetical protein